MLIIEFKNKSKSESQIKVIPLFFHSYFHVNDSVHNKDITFSCRGGGGGDPIPATEKCDFFVVY